MLQQSILWLFLVLAGLATIVFTYIYFSSIKAEESDSGMENPLKKRFWFLLILFVILGIFASVTIPKSPYFLFANETPTKVVYVSSMQFSFVMYENAADPKLAVNQPIEIQANELVEFRVTSLDVNHGFAIYNEENQLLTQTQAMPGYVNRLRYKFSEPGTYTVFCLEYCGMAHQVMKTTFTVK